VDNVVFKKNVDSVIKRLVNIEADLESVIGTELKANEKRDEEIAKLEVAMRESESEIERAKLIQARVNEFVS
jgi:biotin carboxylase